MPILQQRLVFVRGNGIENTKRHFACVFELLNPVLVPCIGQLFKSVAPASPAIAAASGSHPISVSVDAQTNLCWFTGGGGDQPSWFTQVILWLSSWFAPTLI